MRFILTIFILFYSAQGFSKSMALSYNFVTGFYSFEYQIKPNRTIGLLYNSINQSDDTYKYEGAAYGLSLSTKGLTDDVSFDLFLSRIGVARFQCSSCVKENMIEYFWGFSAQKNWIWNWGLYIYLGAGFSFQRKTYDYREPSFKGPNIYIPLGLGFSF